MPASTLLRDSQTAHVQSENLGTAESVQYFHQDGTDETVRAFVDTQKGRAEKSKIRYDEMVFHSVILTKAPTKRDYIVRQGEELLVDTWSLQNGFYSITTVSNEALKNRRR